MISMSLTMTGTTIGSIWLPTHIEILLMAHMVLCRVFPLSIGLLCL